MPHVVMEKYRKHIYIHQDQQERDDSDNASEEDERVRLYNLRYTYQNVACAVYAERRL